MANNLLPARAGEVARAYVVNRQLPVRFTTALASVGVERMFDGLVLVSLMAVAISAPSFPPQGNISGTPVSTLAAGVALLFGTALVLALLAAHRPAAATRLAGAAARRVLPASLAGRVTAALEGLLAGLAVLKHPRRFAAVVAWSLLLWLVYAVSFALCFRAFGLPLPFEAALLLQGVIAVGVAIPAAPGFWGVFEAATRVSLVLYGVAPDQAVSYAVTYHVATFVPITLLGLYSQSRVHVHLAELRRADAVAP
jgi:hypothetical protein